MSQLLERILVFRIGHLGDNLVALPAYWAIRKALPDAHLCLLSNADSQNPHYISASSVIPKTGLFDSYLSYPTSISSFERLLRSIELIRKLRLGRFDAAFYLMPRIRSIKQIERDLSFFRLAGIRRVFGADHLRNKILPRRAGGGTLPVESEAQYLLDCVAESGIDTRQYEVLEPLQLTNEEIARAEQFISDNFGEGKSPNLIAVAPGSKWESKVWPEDNFEEVIKKLVQDFKVQPIVFGGTEDIEKAQRLVAKWATGAIAAGKLNVRESAAALARCRLYIGNDTGTMHLAAAVGTPCVAIFAAVDYPGRWYPLGEEHRVFRKSVECEGCQSAKCFNQGLCLSLIGPDEVYEAAGEILRSSLAVVV